MHLKKGPPCFLLCFCQQGRMKVFHCLRIVWKLPLLQEDFRNVVRFFKIHQFASKSSNHVFTSVLIMKRECHFFNVSEWHRNLFFPCFAWGFRKCGSFLKFNHFSSKRGRRFLVLFCLQASMNIFHFLRMAWKLPTLLRFAWGFKKCG